MQRDLVQRAQTGDREAFSELIRLDTIALGTAAVRGLLERYPVPRREIGALIWGGVILPAYAPNVGREIVLDLSREGRLDPEIEALTVTRACASGLQAVTLAAGAIERGDADLVIAGGSDSTSNTEVKLPQKLVHAAAPFVFGKPTASAIKRRDGAFQREFKHCCVQPVWQ